MRWLIATMLAGCVMGSVIPCVMLAQESSAPPPKGGATQVNLNTATAAQLEALPGIGPKMAERIIEYRQKNGNFKKVEDLMNVTGIGEKSFLKLKNLVTVGAPKPEKTGGSSV